MSEIGDMTLVNLADGQRIATLGNCSAISPVGANYTTASESGIQIRNWQRHDREEGNQALILATDGTTNADTVTFSPDGLQLAFGGPESGVFVANLAEVRRRLAELQAPARDENRP